jgi:hypothetical protein
MWNANSGGAAATSAVSGGVGTATAAPLAEYEMEEMMARLNDLDTQIAVALQRPQSRAPQRGLLARHFSASPLPSPRWSSALPERRSSRLQVASAGSVLTLTAKVLCVLALATMLFGSLGAAFILHYRPPVL